MKRRGKKTAAWESTRAKLKVRHIRAGIVRCEYPQCGSDFALSFGHRLKRRFITTQEELETCALVCQQHHSLIEALPHEEMYRIVTEIIAARETPV